jgi:uncharacterized membrane protein YfcA
MPDLTLQWTLVFVACCLDGHQQRRLPSGLLHVTIFAFLFSGGTDRHRAAMLIVGDICAVTALHQHARWDYVRRMLPPACVGIVIGALLMRRVNESMFRPVRAGSSWACGAAARAHAAARLVRQRAARSLFRVGHGTLRGDYDDAGQCRRPDLRLMRRSPSRYPSSRSSARARGFFFIINSFKVPFSIGLGLIHGQTLLLNLILSPVIVAGVFGGRWIINRIPQRLFDEFLLAFAALAALRLIGAF